jgi:pimeloyl-ACP methyl ester carboxylesterase
MDRAPTRLASGAEVRFTGPRGGPTVVLANGGQAAEVEGTWSATLEWLVGRLTPRFPDVGFAEVRYRVKSWNRLDLCEEDVRAAVDEVAAPRTLLVGFSMGGAVTSLAADAPGVVALLGLAPWLPDRLDLGRLAGLRLDVLHGTLDHWLPGIPGVSPDLSRRGFERAAALGAVGTYELIRGALHGAALRSPWGALVPLPRASQWANGSARAVERFYAAG